MGDYSINLSYLFNNAAKAFSGEISFRYYEILSGKVCDLERTESEGELSGIVKFNKDGKVMLNLFKRFLNDGDIPVIEFQVFGENASRDSLFGKYNGAWRYRGNIEHNSKFSDYCWLSRTLSDRIWINDSASRENRVLIELLPFKTPPQPYSPEISQEASSKIDVEQDLKTEPAL